MKNFPVALQLYSVRDEMAADFEDRLRKVKALGYDGVEFAGLFVTAPLISEACVMRSVWFPSLPMFPIWT